MQVFYYSWSIPDPGVRIFDFIRNLAALFCNPINNARASSCSTSAQNSVLLIYLILTNLFECVASRRLPGLFSMMNKIKQQEVLRRSHTGALGSLTDREWIQGPHSSPSFLSRQTTTNQAMAACLTLCIVAGYGERNHKAYSMVQPQSEMAKQVSEEARVRMLELGISEIQSMRKEACKNR